MRTKIWIYPFILIGITMLFTINCGKEDSNPTGSNNNPTPTTGWSVLGNLDVFGVHGLYLDKNGNLFAAGSFMNTSGKRYVAKWDGTCVAAQAPRSGPHSPPQIAPW